MAYHGLSEHTQRIDDWPETGGEEPADARDRLVVHGVWEGLLALVVVLVGFVVFKVNPDALLGLGLQAFLLLAAAVGFVAVGLGWSLRAAVPNLATGSVAMAAAVFFTRQAEGGLGFGVGVTLAAAAATGVLLAVVVVALHVPAWAGSFALVLLLGGWLMSSDPARVPDGTGYDPAAHAPYWFVGFAAISVIGGLLGMTGGFRSAVGASRTVADPAERLGFGAGMSALAALVASCVLAAVGGVLMAFTGVTAGSQLVGVEWTGLALGVVLIGGTSAYGRRGGLFGTLFGVVLLGLVLRLAAVQGWSIPVLWYAGAAIVLGLLVTRLVETFGRRRAAADEESNEWASDVAWPAGRPSPPAAGPGYGEAGRPGGHGYGVPPRHLDSGPQSRPLLALPAGSAAPQAGPDNYGEVARSGRLGGPTGPGGAAESDRFGPGGAPMWGRIGDRADRLPHRRPDRPLDRGLHSAPTADARPPGPMQGDVVVQGEVVPGYVGRGHAPQRQAAPTGPIWDVDPRYPDGPAGGSSPSPY